VTEAGIYVLLLKMRSSRRALHRPVSTTQY
jgi:hypothetical protein